MSTTLSDFARSVDAVAARLEQDKLRSQLRRELFRIAGHWRKVVAADLASAVPELGQRAAKTVMRGVYRELTGFRIRVSNSRRNGMVATGRPGQPALPLAYWYEHGFRERRTTRRGGYNRGPATPHRGVHILDRHAADIKAAETQYNDALGALIEKHLQNLYGK